MRRKSRRFSNFTCAMLTGTTLLIGQRAWAGTIHVDHESTHSGPGSSIDWSDAFVNLDGALAVASGGDQIWIADGEYVPTAQNDPQDPHSATFTIPVLTGGL